MSEVTRPEPIAVTIRTAGGLTVSLEIPQSWEAAAVPVDGADAQPVLKLRSPTCVAELLATLVDVGHRLTRQALVEEMERRGRRWSEATIGEVLTQLSRLGVVNNSQAGSHKGYGLPDW